MIKILGGVMVIAACWYLGHIYGKREEIRRLRLFEMKRALSYLGSEIAYSIVPLPEALIHTANKYELFSGFFNEFAEKIKTGEDLEAILINSLHMLEQCGLTREDISAVASGLSALATPDINAQEASIKLINIYLDEKCAILLEDSRKSGKLFRSLGGLLGVLVVILLF